MQDEKQKKIMLPGEAIDQIIILVHTKEERALKAAQLSRQRDQEKVHEILSRVPDEVRNHVSKALVIFGIQIKSDGK